MSNTTAFAEYESRKARLAEQILRSGGIRLDKKTSNLFRRRTATRENLLSVHDFNHVLSINKEEGWADVEGMTTYEEFVKETLKYGFMPAVVPQLKTITVGGAVSGVGIEATSFRYGLVHETVLEVEILLADGATIVCNSRHNADLFYGFPNSYGTFGYALRLRMKLIPVKPFVKIEHTHFDDTRSYFSALEKVCRAARHDFVDGTIFGADEMYITTGTFVDTAPNCSDYTYMDIYYKSIRTKNIDYLSAHDFIWRWDTDWFWCSDAFGAQRPLIRKIFGKKRLNSATYWKISNVAQRHPFIVSMANRFVRKENVIQDVDIPIENAPRFAEFFLRDIGITPIWICPIGAYQTSATSPSSISSSSSSGSRYPLYPINPTKLYINFGFWSTVTSDKEPGHYNRLVEQKVSELGGIKGLYSDSFYTREDFWKIYGKQAYDVLKQKYDPQGKLKELYEKCVERK